ncbi:DUF58 domain-containing protein [Candidatus Methylospira mobilis]|uniref:DUF58 domain-containing protein n=1 Tax=Candidatus Methylospira mobilis TaxID=1808979 RepID=UPI0028E98152|nr:DUF58 domain-containing protein [Candidatus Methylospira mobilis]WNV06518.1 DUF58 domain-containing protein [Candidatus Methylospira mobilis]
MIFEFVTMENEVAAVSLPTLIGLSRNVARLRFSHHGRHAVQGGAYLSAFKGRGMEFAETRPYTAGDDIRNLDWRVTARTGKTHTKLFQEERERPVFIAVDARRSMFFATRGCFKSVLASQMAALIAWSVMQHGDRIGGQIFSERSSLELKPEHGRRAVLHFLRKLTELQPAADESSEERGLPEALTRLHRHVRPGSLVFLLSDFRGYSRACETALLRLRRHSDVVLLKLYDPLESTLPDQGRYDFSFGRRRFSLHATQRAADAYTRRFQENVEMLSALSRSRHMRFGTCSTQQDPLPVLMQIAGVSSQSFR